MNYHEEVQVPLMTQGMTHGVLERWLVASGDRVEVGQPIFHLEVDGVTLEIENLHPGTITISGMEGSTYEVGAKIGQIECTEEERVETEIFGIHLTYDMRQKIEEQHGSQSRNEWLRKTFSEFIQAKLNQANRSTPPI